MTLFFTELQKAHKHKMFCCKPFRPIWTEKMTYISIPNLIHRSATLWGYCTPFFIQNNLNYYHMTQMWHIIYWIFVFKNLHCGENLQYTFHMIKFLRLPLLHFPILIETIFIQYTYICSRLKMKLLAVTVSCLILYTKRVLLYI